MAALLFLTGSALFGAGLVRRLLGRTLTRTEQAIFGLTAGWMLSCLLAYAAARALGRLTAPPLVALTLALWAAALLLLLPEIRRLRAGGLGVPRPAGQLGLLVVFALFAPVFWRLFAEQSLVPGDGGLYAGERNRFDLVWHVALANSFLHGQNFPPVYTPLPPAPLLYPFMPDFQVAALCALGRELHTALTLTGVVLSSAVAASLYLLARRVLGDEWGRGARYAQPAAALAVVLFLLGGGLGFALFVADWRASGASLSTFWLQLPADYTDMPGRQIHWTNVITGYMFPQRACLYGLAASLLVFTVFAACWRRWEDGREAAVAWDGRRELLAAGALTGLLPLFHTHSYLAVGLVSVFLFALRPRREWLAFWLPAVLVAAPLLVRLAAHAAGSDVVRFRPGWRSAQDTSFFLYWMRNLGVLLVLLPPAWLAAPRAWRRFYLAFCGLMLVAQVVVFTPNAFDNIKLMYCWWAASCVLVATWLARLAAGRLRLLVAALLVLACTASGILSLARALRGRRLTFDDAQVAAARFAREHTAPRALFLAATEQYQPVLALAGRPVLRGDTGLLFSHGYDIRRRVADIKSIYQGDPEAAALLARHRVEYVYLGRREAEKYGADREFFERNFPAVFRAGDIAIYDTRAAAASREAGAEPAEPPDFAARLDSEPDQYLSEFPRAAFALYRYHKLAYGRAPNYEEMRRDLGRVGQGVRVGAPGWERVLEENKAGLTEEIVRRAEFAAAHDGLTDEQYVEALYGRAGVAAADERRSELAGLLAAGRETRAGALRRVAEERDFFRREYNAAFLLMHYFGYLGRDPDSPPDNNWDGFNFWLRRLDANEDYTGLTGLFIESPEFNRRRK